MSCYHPLVAFRSGSVNKETGKERLIIKGSYIENHSYDEIIAEGGIFIPCGRCLGCRLDYSRKWADRMMLELETAGKGIFLTLTYDNEHCPWSMFDENGSPIFGTLCKRDFQLFMKSLRKEYDKKDLKIRFFASGEYGDRYKRPHYHTIIFGIGLSDLDDCKLIGRNDLGQPYYVPKKIQEIWHRGIVSVSDVSYETCAYVARYVTKKMSGEKALCYAERNCIPEFSLMSRRPGLGAEYLKLHPNCLDFGKIDIMTPKGGKEIPIPKYYYEKLNNEKSELYDPERYVKIKEQRQKFASDKMLLELSKTDLGLGEYLEVKEEERKNLIKVLKRRVE